MSMSLRVAKDKFYARVVKTGGPQACWPWTGGTFHKRGGYGKVQIGGKVRRAHVVAWEWHYGRKVPKGKVVRHSCDNPECVNPAHLLLGTQADNVRDRVERGREGDRSGEKNGRAKINPDIVRDIRRRAAGGETYAGIARDVGLLPQAVSNVVRGKSWNVVS